MLVAIVYATSVAREDGQVVFHADVYGHDRTLQMLLAGESPDSVHAERSRAMARRHPEPRPAAPPPPHSPLLPLGRPPESAVPPVPRGPSDRRGP